MRQIKRILMMLTLVATLSSCEDLKIIFDGGIELKATVTGVAVDGVVNCYEVNIPKSSKFADLTITAKLIEGTGSLYKVNGDYNWEGDDYFQRQYKVSGDNTKFSFYPQSLDSDKYKGEKYLRPFKFALLIEAKDKEPYTIEVSVTKPLNVATSEQYSTVGRRKRIRMMIANEDDIDNVERVLADYSDVSFSSDDESIATIDSQGYYIAHKVGKTTLRGVSKQGQEIKANLEVIDFIAYTGFTYRFNGELFNSWDYNIHEVKEGESFTIQVIELFPKNPTPTPAIKDGWDKVFYNEFTETLYYDSDYYRIRNGFYTFETSHSLFERNRDTQFNKLSPEEKILLQACNDGRLTDDYGDDFDYYEHIVWFKLVK